MKAAAFLNYYLTCCAIEIIFSDKIVAGGTPATAMAAVGVPTNRKLKMKKTGLFLIIYLAH